jgi:molecular chaperone HtpG
MISIPRPLNQVISDEPRVAATVLSLIADFNEVFANRSLAFFPEYTDHSLMHMQEVLETAATLIPEHLFDAIGRAGAFTSTDAGVLSAAVLLHDIGMHLTEDGFFFLLESGGPLVKELDMKSWMHLWSDFCTEARHWDGSKLERILGSADPISTLPPTKASLTYRDRLLIGEFIRRNHARIAHEAAVFGIPGTSERMPILANPPTAEFADLVGLIARSHGLSLRAAASYSKRRYSRTFQGIHAVYLMAVLRIADYLQVQPSRAPGARLQIEALRSPLSVREWRVHASVRDISYDEDDPESVFVTATPPDLESFLHVQTLLSGQQL